MVILFEVENGNFEDISHSCLGSLGLILGMYSGVAERSVKDRGKSTMSCANEKMLHVFGGKKEWVTFL